MTDFHANRSRALRTASRVLLGATLFGGVLFAIGLVTSRVPEIASSAQARVRPEPLESAQDLSLAFKQASREVQPTVVNIRSIHHVPAGMQGQQEGMSPGDALGQLFGQEFMDRFFGQGMPQGPQEQEGMGSGVIVSPDGYVLTNFHVVKGADELEVRLSDSRTFSAKVVGTDDKTDLAVVKIDAKRLPAAKFGDSDALEVGDWVMAVGNPFGFDHTVTAGIVSAKGRSGVGIVDYEDFIQTDAAINPGNSGGPLLNLKGEVVGINTAIVSRAGGWNGIGLAIPINMAKQIMDSIISDGRVIRGWMGVGIQDLDEDLARSFGYSGSEGVLVSQVLPDGPAGEAGFKEGDIVTEYDGKPMKNATQLRNAVAATAPGSKKEIKVFREGRTLTLNMKIAERENDEAEVAEAGKASGDLGIVAETLTPQAAQQLGYKDVEGVLIRQVVPGSLAGRAGLSPNEVIVSVNGEDTPDVKTFQAVVKKADLKQGIRLKVVTAEGMQRFVFLKSRS